MQIHAISNTEKFISFKNKKVSNKNTPNVIVPYSQCSSENIRAKYAPHSLVDGISSEMKGFFEFLKTVKIGEESLASQLKGFTFAFDKTFDVPAWTNFISEMDSATAMFENETSVYEKSFLELLNSVKPISELFNEKDFKPNKAIEFLDEYYNRDDEEISKFPIKAQLDFMIEAAKSKEPVEEFVHDLFYFRSLMTKDGQSVLAERNGGMGKNQINALKYVLSVDKGSVDTSNLEMLLELVQDGVVGIHVFNNIPVKGKINSLVLDDIDKLYVAYSTSVKPIDAFVPTYKTKRDAQNNLKMGDVYELDGEDKIFIVNRYGLSTQLGLDKKTYFDLFPPIERYASTQGDVGNCWELTALNALFADPQEREKILGLFSQEGNDVVIRFPNGNYTKHIFKNGNLPPKSDKRYFSRGAKGIRLLEFADGKESHADKIRFLMLQYRQAYDSAKTENEKRLIDEKASRLIDLLEENWDSVVVSLDEKQDWTFEEWKKEKHGFDSGSTVSRDGGNSSELFMRLLYPIEVYNKDEMARNDFISYAENFENNVVTYGIPRGFPQEKAPEGLLVDHSYRMYPLDVDENGRVSKFKLIDPHSIIEIPISYEQIKEIGGIVDIAKKNNLTGKQTVSFKGRQITLNGTLRKKSLSPSLVKDAGFSETEVHMDALKFLRMLDNQVIKHINSVDKKGTYFARLLTKTGEFENINFDYIKNMASFLNLLGTTYANGETLLSQLNDFSFVAEKDFDPESWSDFVFLFDNKQRYNDSTFLEKFLAEKNFSDIFYSKDFDPNSVLDFVTDIKSRIDFYTRYELFEILDFVSCFAADRYDSIQRMDTLSYFQELRDVNGEPVFPQKQQEICQLEAFKYMLNINPASVNASNMQMLLDLVVNGVVDKHVFDYLPTQVELNSLVVSDIDLLYEAYINGTEPIDAFIPTFVKENDALKQLKVGDVFELEDEEYIRIVTDKNTSTQLNISKQTYFDLFPPVERYATTQGQIGNCWQMAGMNSIFRDANERVNILKMFYQDGDDILIKFPKGEYEEIRFENGNLPSSELAKNYSKGAKGFKLLEYADGKELQAYRIKNYFLYLLKELASCQTDDEKKIAQEKLQEIQKLIELGIENLVVRRNDKTDEWECYVFKETIDGYNTAETQGRNGGDTIKFYQRIGYQNSFWEHIADKKTQENVTNPKTFDKYIVVWTTKEGLRNNNYETLGIHENHAYPITPAETDKQGNILSYNVFDPWGCVKVKLSFEQLREFGSFVQFAERKSYK